jgi:hypothetical protein
MNAHQKSHKILKLLHAIENGKTFTAVIDGFKVVANSCSFTITKGKNNISMTYGGNWNYLKKRLQDWAQEKYRLMLKREYDNQDIYRPILGSITPMRKKIVYCAHDSHT